MISIERTLDSLKIQRCQCYRIINKFDGRITELSSAGIKVDPKKKLHYLLSALPESCNYLINTVE